MRLQTIVALTDFSTAAEHALDRAALLAAKHKARLHIVFGAEEPDPKFADPQDRLDQRARQLAQRHDLRVKAMTYRGDGVVQETLRAAAGADLLVLDNRASPGLGGLWLGGTLAQILRRSPCPVLVVQQPAREAYAHVLVAVDFSAASSALACYSAALDGAAAVELLHTVDMRAQASVQAVRDYREEVRRHSQDWLLRLSQACGTQRNRVLMTVGTGGGLLQEAAAHQQRTGADLVALAHRRRGWLLDVLLGSMARRLLGSLACDVLVYPQDYTGAAACTAAAQSRVARRWTQAI